ncbi:MAG TPA: carboxypeptidase-like regulatory domain-containing protein, partial [Flavisolibacter sp.]|nr:carboxypeptidase-like regulatory domain-containing protein [Flavisolibacter sp.]
MRLIAVLLFASCLHVSAKSFSQRINISEKNISLKNIFYLIKQQTGYSFLWNQQLVENVRPLNIDIRNATLSQVLDQCLTGLPLMYSIREKDKIVFLMEKLPGALSATKDSSSAEVLAPPPIEIQGKLTDEQGFPLQGVSIAIKGTTRGTTSNENGLFTIQANPGETLQFSMIGYTTYSIKLKNNTNLKIVLQNSAVNLSDVVVV